MAGDVTPRDDLEAAVLEDVAHIGAPWEVIEIDPALADTAEFCEHYGYSLDQSANCILVASRTEPLQVAACLVLANTKLDVNKRVRKLMGVRRLSFASPDLVRVLTGMEIGGVTPFALPDDIPLYIDQRIRTLDRAIVGGGSRRLKLLVDPVAFDALPGAEWITDLAIVPETST